MHSFSRQAPQLILLLLVAALSIHFGMTVVHLIPLNPIKLRIAPLVEGYMAPWFLQDWHLFAPTPINETRMLLVTCRLRQANGMTVETAWADVSTPLWEAQARQRFSSAAPLARLQGHALQLYFDKSELAIALERHRTANNSEVHQLAAAIRTAEAARRALAARVLARLGSAYCDHWHGTGQTTAVRVGLAVLRFPRFSQRHLPDTDGASHFYPLPWMAYEHVAPFKGSRE